MMGLSAGVVGGAPFCASCYGSGKALPVPNRNIGGFSSFKRPSQPAHLVIPTRPISSLKSAVASIDSNQISSADSSDKQQASKYYFVIANAKFMLDEEEHFMEQMFERLRLYQERKKERDFWLVIEPKFLDNFPDIAKRLGRPAVALVSTNGPWIKFMKLRLDRVLSDSYEADNLEAALASNPTTIEFKKPKTWTAPYTKYEYGWWEPFLMTGTTELKA